MMMMRTLDSELSSVHNGGLEDTARWPRTARRKLRGALELHCPSHCPQLCHAHAGECLTLSQSQGSHPSKVRDVGEMALRVASNKEQCWAAVHVTTAAIAASMVCIGTRVSVARNPVVNAEPN